MMPDLENAALRAAETLVKYQITTAPVSPLPIIKSLPGVILLSFTELSARVGIDRQNALGMFGEGNQDAATTVITHNGQLRYVVTYNQRLPFYMLQRAIARELGHIVLGHDGSRPDDVRTAEAVHFARHLLCPRPLVRAVQDSGVPLTAELLGNMTGCFERCIAGLRVTPGSHVPAELNRQIRSQFADYVDELLAFHAAIGSDPSAPADLGTYMDNYAE